MPYISLLVGQCGNQLGSATLEEVASNCDVDLTSFFRESRSGLTGPARVRVAGCRVTRPTHTPAARAVLVDSEPRVVTRAMRESKAAGFRFSKNATVQRVSASGGCGNNWGKGFAAAAELGTPTLDALRREMEAADSVSGIFLYHSLAGGTGSGLGSAITQAAKDEWGRLPIFNIAVWPFADGDVVVQPYNTVCALSSLQSHSDAILCLHNADAAAVCKRRLNITHPSMKDINSVFATQVSQLLLPSFARSRVPSLAIAPVDVATTACAYVVPSPLLKLLSLRSIPSVRQDALAFESTRWDSAVRSASQILLCNGCMEDGLDWKVTPASHGRNRCCGAYMAMRGPGWDEADLAPMHAATAGAACVVAGNDVPVVGGHSKSLVLLSNDQRPVGPLQLQLDRMASLMEANAFVHQFEGAGVSRDDLQDAAATAECVLADYVGMGGN